MSTRQPRNTNKTVETSADVTAFIDSVADERQRIECAALVQVFAEVTGYPATMWGTSLIGFGRYHYRYESGREGEAALVSVSPRKGKLSMYFTYGVEEENQIRPRLGPHTTGKACVHIKRLADIDLDVLRELIAWSVRRTNELHATPWTVTARNLAEHASNRIHTDEGAREQGFPAALVAGVTTYAYLTRPIVDLWGDEWLRSGAVEVRFRSPVFDHDEVRLPLTDQGDGTCLVEAFAGDRGVCATANAVRDGRQVEPLWTAEELESAEPLPNEHHVMIEAWADYGTRAGDDHPLYTKHGIVHPSVWPGLANHTTHAHVVRGSWVHTNSLIRHHATCPIGSAVTVEASVLRRWPTPRGERAVLAVRIIADHDGSLIATLRHEALVALNAH